MGLCVARPKLSSLMAFAAAVHDRDGACGGAHYGERVGNAASANAPCGHAVHIEEQEPADSRPDDGKAMAAVSRSAPSERGSDQ